MAGHRIYTRSGDSGTTRLSNGTRIEKQSHRVGAYGTLYELNAQLGHARAFVDSAQPLSNLESWQLLQQTLQDLQHRLFYVGRDISGRHQKTGEPPSTTEAMTRDLERIIDQLRTETPPWRPFTVPEGSIPATALYVATTVCRRAEREILRYHHAEPVPKPVLVFVNRLSDFLFVAARFVNHALGYREAFVRAPEDL